MGCALTLQFIQLHDGQKEVLFSYSQVFPQHLDIAINFK